MTVGQLKKILARQMKTLAKNEKKLNASIKKIKEMVYKQNMALVKHNLVVLTWGNVSAIDRKKGIVVIKPSGVSYKKMKPNDMVVVDLKTGQTIDSKYKPSSDTPTHLEIYRKFKNVGGIVHTHSTFATAWAQAGLDIPALGTTHADAFYGKVPCIKKLSKKEIAKDYELNTAKAIIKTFKAKKIDYEAVPGALLQSHGPFTWGANASEAVKNAITLEEIAKMAYLTLKIKKTSPIDKYLADKHYFRKHGKNAYYGQKKK